MYTNPSGPGVPRGVLAELTASVSRTGWTDALRIAEERLPRIFAMSPKQFEDYSAELYRAGV